MRPDTYCNEMVGPRNLVRRLGGADAPRFSICTLVTRWPEYEQCLASLRSHGYDEFCCEYLVLDNSASNVADAYIGYNEFLQAARGEFVVLLHQDIVLLNDGRVELEAWLAKLDELDPDWAICGNAGHTDDGWPAICISHPYKEVDIAGGPFPARVVSLDENFLVVRRLANLALSRDLAGFHHYGPDLCLIADILGWNSYVIGFYLRHNSGGSFDDGYSRSREAIRRKYRRAFRPRWVHLITEMPFHVSGSRAAGLMARVMRKGMRFLRLLPRHEDLRDPVKRANRDRRRRSRARAVERG